jgi:DUF4097 and DUF4098 domain-containing protein YvlB
MLRPLPPLALGSLVLAGCHVSIGGHALRVDGVELPAKHTETLEVGAWPASGLTVDAVQGGVRLEPTAGANTITVELHEVTHGDATAFFEDGRLVAHTSSGEPAAIGRVVVRSSGPIPSLDLSTGMGDVEVDAVRVERTAEVSTGVGDVTVRGIGRLERIAASTGMGDVRIDGAECRVLAASSGMGDVEVRGVSADEADVSSGMGDVDVRDSTFDRLDADAGLGDVTCRGTTYRTGELDTGFGDVSRD